MARRVEVVVLCEDALHRSFATAFLNRTSVPIRLLDVRIMGTRSNVLDAAPKWVRAVRTRGATAHLVILVDLDTASAAYIDAEIAKRLTAASAPTLTTSDNVVVIGAKREIDTWVTYLKGGAVDEANKFPVKDTEGRSAGADLGNRCKAAAPLVAPPSSLTDSCARWSAYRGAKGL
jgi:hypothetical protein